MIVWIASDPRSGNTFLRLLLHRRYGVTSSTVYSVDGVSGPGTHMEMPRPSCPVSAPDNRDALQHLGYAE